MFEDILKTVNTSFFSPGLLQTSWNLAKHDFGFNLSDPDVSMASGRHTLRMKMSSPSK